MKTELEKLCETAPRLTVKCSFMGDIQNPWPSTDGSGSLIRMQHYRVTLRRQGRQLTTDFYQGMGHTKEPSAADVVHCLCSDAMSGSLSFEEFCSDFGYNNDSISAQAIWRACQAVAPKVRRLLGSDFNKFGIAEH